MTEELRTTSPVKFGTPPASLEEWLETYLRDTEAYRKWTWNPIERLRAHGRIGGLESALILLRYHQAAEAGEATPFPVTIPPHSAAKITVEVPFRGDYT